MKRSSPLPFSVFPDPERDFIAHLAGCRGVITNAGHQLLSETLHLRKPILTLPLEGQYEQRLNARMMERSGRGIPGCAEDPLPALQRFFTLTDSSAGFPMAEAPAGFVLEDDSLRAARMVLRAAFRLLAAS